MTEGLGVIAEGLGVIAEGLGVIAETLGVIAEALRLIRGRYGEGGRWDYRWCGCAIRQDRDC